MKNNPSTVQEGHGDSGGIVGLLSTTGKSSSAHSRDMVQQAEKLQNGIASLVLNLIETIIEILERQAYRRFQSGTLTDREVEALGLSFQQMRQEMLSVASQFNYQPRALALSLNATKNELLTHDSMSAEPIVASENGSISIADLVDKLIDNQAVIAGDVRLAVAGIDLVTLDLLASIRPSLPTDQSKPTSVLMEARHVG